jgi:multiple sugar transport system permease protein
MTVTKSGPAADTAAGPSRRAKNFKSRVLIPYAMLAPGIILFLVFMAAPIVYTLVLSFQKKKVSGLGLGKGSQSQVFAGLENYVSALTDPEFLGSVLRVLLYGLILIPLMLGFALLFALLLDSRRTRAGSFSRTAIFLPYAVPAVISSLLWGFLYLPGVSPFHFLARQFGVALPSLLDPNLVTFAICNIALWGGVGFNMIVMYTSLKAVPSEIYEAAKAGRLLGNPDGPANQDSHHRPVAGDDCALLDDRHAPGLRRTHHPAPAWPTASRRAGPRSCWSTATPSRVTTSSRRPPRAS